MRRGRRFAAGEQLALFVAVRIGGGYAEMVATWSRGDAGLMARTQAAIPGGRPVAEAKEVRRRRGRVGMPGEVQGAF